MRNFIISIVVLGLLVATGALAKAQPTLGADCGSATLAAGSINKAGKITIAADTDPSTCTLTFSTTLAHEPACFSENETRLFPNDTQTTTTTLTIFATHTWADGNVVSYGCNIP